MLKAVRFEETDHKHLLEFIDWYTDKKGKKNESEAIRFLMQKGFESLQEEEKAFTLVNADTNINIETKAEIQPSFNVENLKKELVNDVLQSLVNQQPKKDVVDIEGLKKDLMNDILKQINVQTFDSLNNLVEKLNNFQPTVIQQPTIPSNNQENVEISKPKIKPKQVEIPADTNPLLANLLANANR